MIIRDAVAKDVPEMSAFLQELTALGKRTSRNDPEFVRAYYIDAPVKIRCTLAEEDGAVLGFQALRLAEDGNEWGVPTGWGIIGTHIRPTAARRGVGRALFAVTLTAAREAGLTHLDASIRADNPEALAFYEAMGFRAYRWPDGFICKAYAV